MTQSLVLLPGLLCDHRLWAGQLPALETASDVLVADLSRADTIAGIAEQVLARAPARFSLAGLSMGGYVAFEILRRRPSGSPAWRCSTARPAPTPGSQGPPPRPDGAGEQGRVPRRRPALAAPVHPPRRTARPALTATVQAMAESTGKDGFLRQQTAIMDRPDSRPGLPAIACPTLVLAGRDDAVTPPELQLKMATLIPDATLVLIPRCGHLAPLERPEAVTHQLLALARRPATARPKSGHDRARPDPRLRLADTPS